MKIARSAAVGLVATGVDYLSLFVLIDIFHVATRIANVPALLLGALIQFVGNRNYVFKAKTGSLPKQMIVFALAETVAFAINAFGFDWVVKTFDIHYAFTRAGVSFMVFIFYSYPCWRWVFKKF